MSDDAETLLVVVLLATVILRIALVAIVVWLIFPRRRNCPQCSEATVPLFEATYLRFLLLERRWCMSCGWNGIARKSRSTGAGTADRSMPVTMVLLLLVAGTGGCRPQRDDVARLFGESSRWVDLTHSFDERTIYWPTAEPFRLKMVTEGPQPGGYFYSAANFSAAEHGGTHLDAPVHFAEGRHTTGQVPVSQLIGPAVVVDVSAKTSPNADYRVTVADLEAFETAHGRIADGTIVLFRTGWGSRWPDRRAYLGTEASGAAAVPLLHFPGIDSSAARWLVSQRKVDAVGIDTPSIDYGQSSTFDTHQILFAANIPAFENVANLDQLPNTGAYVVALPMKIARGTGGPLRIVAALPGAGTGG